ncbi:MAG: glycosyltransferase family 9 protein [Sinobacteraceae bacterium]|nr:glycosyltransferase family 9 protein [Nevskiaceae bacterium]
MAPLPSSTRFALEPSTPSSPIVPPPAPEPAPLTAAPDTSGSGAVPAPVPEPPRSVCLLRLSAIGDTCHVVPLLRALQRAWPQARFTWIIGRIEARLMTPLLPEVEFITVDKRAGFGALRTLRRQLAGRHFDLLLHLQLALRASLVSTMVRAQRRIGFDRARARELQWLFTDEQVAPRQREHVLDSFLGFATALGVEPQPLRWDLPLPPDALAYARALVPETPQENPAASGTLVISACSSHALRNWSAARYAAVARHAVQRHGMRVILSGGPAALEREMAAAIARHSGVPVLDQVGKDTLPQLLALLARATVLLSPDSGPVHMATLVDLPVIGLYAATNPARSGPYRSRAHCVDAYARAAARFRNSTPEQLPWTTKIERPGVMDLIEVDEVCARLDALLGSRP